DRQGSPQSRSVGSERHRRPDLRADQHAAADRAGGAHRLRRRLGRQPAEPLVDAVGPGQGSVGRVGPAKAGEDPTRVLIARSRRWVCAALDPTYATSNTAISTLSGRRAAVHTNTLALSHA